MSNRFRPYPSALLVCQQFFLIGELVYILDLEALLDIGNVRLIVLHQANKNSSTYYEGGSTNILSLSRYDVMSRSLVVEAPEERGGFPLRRLPNIRM